MKKEKLEYWYVYKHTSPSGKIYIGITKQKPKRRWHKGGGYKGQVFHNAIKKYGWDNIKHEIIAEGLTQQEAEQMEIDLIAKHKSNNRKFGYNVANGGNVIGTHSKETKQKMSTNNQKSKLVICDCMIFNNIAQLEDYYDLHEKARRWLSGKICMPIEWYNRGLRYMNNDNSKIRISNKCVSGTDYRSTSIMCDEIIFNTIKELSIYLDVPSTTISGWVNGKGVPKEYFKRIKMLDGTILKEQKDVSERHKTNCKKVICEEKIFNSAKECAEYYDVPYSSMKNWLNGTNCMPQEWYDRGLRYIDKQMSDYKVRQHNRNIK